MNAYSDFISQVVESVREDEDNGIELKKSIGNLILFGNDSVVNEMINFYKYYGVLDSTQANESFAKIISKMRKDIVVNDKKQSEISLEDIILLYIGVKR